MISNVFLVNGRAPCYEFKDLSVNASIYWQLVESLIVVEWSVVSLSRFNYMTGQTHSCEMNGI